MELRELVEYLTKENKTIATMESCTGGGLANAITNIEGASNILKFSAVTYSNEYKIKMGVEKDAIEKYTVYSEQVAKEMSYAISKFAKSDYGIGITGKLNRIDEANPYGEDNIVFISIYEQEKQIYHTDQIKVLKKTRKENKEEVIKKVLQMMATLKNKR